jgi:hypothetical protein
LGAVVQYALDVVVAVGRHSRQGNTAGVGHRCNNVRGRLPVSKATFLIDSEPVEAAACQKPGSRDAAQKEPRAERGLTSFESTFDGVRPHEDSPY